MASPTKVVPTTIAAALEGVTDDTLRAEGVDLGDGPGTEREPAETPEKPEPDEQEPPDEGDDGAEVEDEPRGGEATAETEEPLKLSREELAAIRADPKLEKTYKAIQRAYTKKTMEHAEAVRLLEMVKADPDNFLEAAAKMRGHTFTRKGLEQPKSEPLPDVAAVSEAASKAAAEKLEKLFGAEAGPVVRQVFEEFARSVVQGTVAPLQATLKNETEIREVNRMISEEAAFKSKHKAELTPEIEAEMVALGNSGHFQPGPQTTPAEYLELLHEVVMARRTRTKASADVVRRVQRNRQDQEPTRGVSSRGGVGRVSKVGEAKSLSEAFRIAERELEQEGRI